jgi:hypothetical protein
MLLAGFLLGLAIDLGPRDIRRKGAQTSIALTYEGFIDLCPILEGDEAQEAPIPIPIRDIPREMDTLALDQLSIARARFVTIAADRRIRLDRLGGINTDIPHALTTGELYRIPIDDALDLLPIPRLRQRERRYDRHSMSHDP